MRKENIKKAVADAKRFILLAQELEGAIKDSAYKNGGETFYMGCPKESGALRRASLDLTRSLAEMRKP